ncbi:hypothetical protein AM500_03075 [Bacillus sp. FJAT-18017]|uniref:DUF6414 family protein n=1 Tax=Bacillus sp. FJAT-18017 TaxID=1705566 RepID=UPI0006AD8FC5|nr:DUF6414 family protein [Bacillus sp. FJAT-18017]ALC88894.1 hypothetical protein AM500_03075 [Bacillus sp. FJAT-18017]
MLKVVYFDEGSALDYIDQYYEGRIEETESEIIKEEANTSASAQATVQIGLPKWMEILDLVAGKFKGRAEGKTDDSNQYLHQKMISGTILTTFKKITASIDSPSNLLELKDFKLNIPPESLTSLKTFTPFLRLFASQIQTIQVINGESRSKNSASDIGDVDVSTLDVSNLDNILENAKGYYEMIASNGKEKKIVRFNLKGLRNNYQLIDFQRMQLTLYGIPVGKCALEELKDLQEFNVIQPEQQKIRLAGDALNSELKTPNEVEIIDILLAGVDASE